jgi:hypothetical protein
MRASPDLTFVPPFLLIVSLLKTRQQCEKEEDILMEK